MGVSIDDAITAEIRTKRILAAGRSDEGMKANIEDVATETKTVQGNVHLLNAIRD